MTSLLYVGEMDAGATSRDRADALGALGASVTSVSPHYLSGWRGRADWLLRSRLQLSPTISRLNADIVDACSTRSFDVLWLDKGWMVHPRTIHRIRPRVSRIVLFNNDNPWGEHERGIWRLHLGLIPLVDEILVPKYSVVRPYELRGARRVSIAEFGFAPARHYAPTEPVARSHELCFIGTALRDGGGIRPHRTELILELARLLPGRISLFGYGWRRAMRGNEHRFKVIADGVYDADYRETIWRSAINLSFVTKDNWEEMSHKAFEITACGGCMLAERASRLEQNFEEEREAAYFSTVEECAAIATELLADPVRCERIASAGHRRATTSGYDNASRLREVVRRSPVLRGYFREA
jgi:spore maturation protein CgeB